MGELTARHAAAARGSRPLARDEHLADPRGRAPARGPRARRARAPPRREGDGARRRGAARAVLDPARARDAWRCAARPSSSSPADDEAARAHLAGLRRGPPPRATSGPPCASTPRSTSRSTRPPARAGSLRLIRPAWDSCERYRPVLLARAASCRTGTRSSTSSCSRRAPPTTRERAGATRSTPTSSSRPTSTRSSSKGSVDLRVLTSHAGASDGDRRTPHRARSFVQRAAPSFAGGAAAAACATSVPEPAPRPGPGHVLAPMCHSRSTDVAWPGLRGNGRQRKFWSSESAPP